MRLVIQRVSSASVSVDGKLHSAVDRGMLVLVGVENGDTEADMQWLAAKTVSLRIFDDENGVMNRSLIHIAEPTRQAEISYACFCLKKKHILI